MAGLTKGDKSVRVAEVNPDDFHEIPPVGPVKILDGVKCWRFKQCSVIRSVDRDRLHLSIAHPTRLPTWDEVFQARYSLLPLGKFFVMVLPPRQYYVNDHKFCFHLWETQDDGLVQLSKEG